MTKNQDLNRLHNRHLAKLLNVLQEIETPKIIIDAIKRQFSFYTNDVKELIIKADDDVAKSENDNSVKPY